MLAAHRVRDPAVNVDPAELVVDEAQLRFSRHLGGTTGRLAAYFAPDLARDALVLDGSLWVVGRTQAWDFPTSEGPAVFPGTWNAFLAEIDDDGGLGRALLLGEGTARAIAGDEGGCGSRARSGCSASTPRSTRRGR